VDIIVVELTDIRRAIGPLKSSDTVLLAVFVIAFVASVIRPCLYPVPMLPVFFPVSNIFGSVNMLVSAFALSFVIIPFAFVYITVSVDKSALAVGLVALPIADILAAIFPDLRSFAFSMPL
jgi:hypothetical protein